MDSISEVHDSHLEKFSPVADRRPFEVILRGGKPWGFQLAGGEGEESPLHISQIEENSGAGNSALLTGDILLSVNGISCGSYQNAMQLVDSAFRTLTLKVLRGGWEPSRGLRPQSSSGYHSSYDIQRRHRGSVSGSESGSVSRSRQVHDDSAIYAQSKQSSTMRPSRPRRGDSFSVGKSHPPPSPSTADPPWSRSSSGYDHHSPHAAPRSSYPEVRNHPRSTPSSKDRRYSDAPPRHHRNRDQHLHSAKSSPNLNKVEPSAGSGQGAETAFVKPKSSPNIPDDLEKENQSYRKRPSMYEPQMVNPAAFNYGKRPSFGRHGDREDELRGEYRDHKSKRYSEDMYTADMKSGNEQQSITSHSLQKYQPDYENVSLLGTAPLESEKISEILDIEDSEGDAPAVPPRPACLDLHEDNPYSPTPPIRDPSSLKYIKVNQNHEKYPSWPVTQPNAASDPSLPINARAQSWTDHTNTSKEFPSKQRLAYTPGLRPLPEKNSPTAERKEEDSSGKARNSSDPGFKNKTEFVYNKYGQVVQRKKDDGNGKRFEEFYVNSKPGYPAPRFDSDGHSYGDKEYNAPSPPERDIAAVDQQVLSQALGTALGEGSGQQPQPQVDHRSQSSHFPTSQPLSTRPAGPKRPGFLAMPAHPLSHSQRVDMATSPLASPRDAIQSPREHSKGLPLSVYSSPLHGKDSIAAQTAANRLSSKAFIVRPTPYYNTSTQTEVPSGPAKMSDSRSRHVEIQTTPYKQFEEKSIQARMSREFQPSDLESSRMRHPSDEGGRRNFFQYPFEGIESIQAKYATDEDPPMSTDSPGNVFSPFSGKVPDDQASIMRKLSEEFYGNKLGMMGEKRHSSASLQEHSPKPIDSSSVMVHSGTMSQAESYSSVVIHPSESAGPFGRDDFGSQSSIADSRHDLLSLASSSKSSMRDSAPRGRNSLDPSFFSHKTTTRPLQESKKFNSLTTIGHQRENSAPVASHHPASSQESLQHSKDTLNIDTKWRNPSTYRNDSSSASEASSPTQPKNSPDTRMSGSSHYSSGSHGDSPASFNQQSQRTGLRHTRMESADSVFSDQNRQREKTTMSTHPDSDSSSATAELLTRKASMRKAYGIYDETEKALHAARREDSGVSESGFKSRSHSQSDTKLLGQIQEVNEGDSSSKQNKASQAGDISRSERLNSWRDDLDKRTGRMQRTATEQISSARDRGARVYEPSRPPRFFDGSIDSGVGSEVSSRLDGQVTPSESSQPNSLSDADLKKYQQEQVLKFVQRKTGKLSNAPSSVEHSPDSSLYESIGTPHSPHSPTSESVSDLISKTNENLAKRADSIRRTGSTSSRSSSTDYMDMGRQDRSRKETEWSRLRSSSSFQYAGSNRSSLCSENTYEDISVFATTTPRGSTEEVPKDAEMKDEESADIDDPDDGTNMESGIMTSQSHYQNFNAARRRPPPPPPRTPSPEPHAPPALPPRNYLRKSQDEESADQEVEGAVEEAKIDFKSLVNQWEHNSPREDMYAAQLRRQAMKLSGHQRGGSGSGSGAAPTSMSVIVSRTQMGISTSFSREPMIAQEATTPTTAGSTSLTSSVTSVAAGALSAQRNSGPSGALSAQKNSGPSGPEFFSPDEAPASDMLTPQSFPQTKDANHAAAGFIDRDTKPIITSVPVSRPPQLPERTVLPYRGDNLPPRVDNLPPRVDNLPPRADNLLPRGENFASRDRSGSEIHSTKDQSLSLSPHENLGRDRSVSDTRVFANQDVRGSSSAIEEKSLHRQFGKESDLPLPSPSRPRQPEGVTDGAELPPPPPDLLDDSGSSLGKGEDQGDSEVFADDSYGAYKNRSNRQVGSYKRSASAAIIRHDNNNVKAATDANSVFTDRRLGSTSWNSESQLLGNVSRDLRDLQPNGGLGMAPERPPERTPPERPPDRPGNVPAFRVDSRPVHNVTKVTGGPQPLQSRHSPQGPSPTSSRTNVNDGGTFVARPYNVEPAHSRVRSDEEQKTNNNATPSAMPAGGQQSRSVKERINNLERKASFTSSPNTTTPNTTTPNTTTPNTTTPNTTPVSSPSHSPHTSTTNVSHGQRWAHAAPFEATHRGSTENLKQRSNNDWASNNARPTVLTDSQSRDRVGGHGEGSTQSYVNNRPRSQSERVKQYDVSPTRSDGHRDQRYAEVPPLPSDSRHNFSHARNSPQGSTNSSRVSASPYNRRESAPVTQISPDAIAVVSPRRQSEGIFSPDNARVPVPGEITVSHARQPSQEELECDQKALELAKEVAGSEKKLSDVLMEDPNQKRMKYMDGLFPIATELEVRPAPGSRRHGSGGEKGGHSPQQEHPQSKEDRADNHKNSLPKEYFVSTPRAVLEMEWRKEASKDFTKNIHDNEALIKQKEELVEKLLKKMDLLKEEKRDLQQEIHDNDALGKQVFDTVEAKCQSASERDKFRTYIDDLEKIVRLLLNLSGQLARAENAVQGLAENADPKLKKMTLDKRERLQVKHAEAKQLKEDIDKRSDNVSAFLRQSLTPDELKDYTLFVKMKSKLMIDLQELEDKITLGHEQIQELKKSIPEHVAPPPASADLSSSSISPPSSPAPSS